MLLDSGASSEELEVEGLEVLDDLGQGRVGDITAEQDTLTSLRATEVHGSLQRSPIGLNDILTEASNLTSTGHLDTEERIGTSKTGPAELGNLGSEVVALDLHEVNGLRDVTANQSLGSNIDEVGTQDLADEGEGAGGTKVALNDLQLRLSTLQISLDDLHVEGTGDVPGLGDLLGNVLNAAHDRLLQVGGGEDEGGITGVNTSGLNVLTHGVEQKLAVGSDSVNVDLLGTLDELGDDNGVVGGDGASVEELLLELIDAVDDVHGSTRQDVTGTNEDRVANSLSEALSLGDGGKLLPGGLVNTNAVQNLRELVTVLSTVNVLGVSSENVSTTSLLEAESNVLRKLTTDRDDNTAGALELVDIHDTLVAEFFEVELVSGIEVSGVGLGVVVDHDSLLAHAAQGKSGVDSTPVKLNGASNTVDTASQNDDTVVIEADIVGGSVVGGVKVVGVGRELGGEGVDLLNPGPDTEGLAAGANVVLGGANELRDLLVRETKLLGLQQDLLLEAEEAADVLELVVAVNDVLELVQEPLVDLGQLVNLVNGVVLVKHSLANSQPAAVGGVLQDFVEVLEVVTLEANEAGVNLADSLLERLLEGTTDSHDFTDGLHGTANVAVDMLELAQIPPGDLGDDVVQTGLEVGSSGLGNRVGKLGEGVSQTDLGSSVSQGVTSGLGGQSRGTRETSVDLNDTVVKAIGLQSVLDVTFTNDTQVADNLDSSGTEHVVLLIRQGLTGSNDDTVTGVDTKGVEVLHVANSDAVVVSIADNLILDFLPATERLLDQNLGRKGQGARGQVLQLLGVGSETGTQTTQSVGRTDDDGVSNSLSSLQGLVDGADRNGFGDGDVDLVQGLGEKITVLTGLQGLDAGSQNANTVALEDTHAVHLHTQVQGGLTTEREEDTIGSLPLNDIGDILGGNGEVVHFIRELVIGLNRRNVGVDQDGLDTGLLEGLESLRTY